MMPLTIREVPAQVLESFQTGTGLEWYETFAAGAVPERAPVELPPPHPIYYLSLLAIANGAGLQAAVQTGWTRHAEIGGVVHAVRMDVVGDRVFNLSEHYILSAREQRVFDVRRIESILGAGTTPFEYRKLWIPPLISSAVWLSAPDPTADLLIPVDSTLADLVPEQTYNANQLIGRLRDVAVEMIATSPQSPQAE